MHWQKGEKRDLLNVARSLALGLRVAVRQARGEELSPEDERALWRQIKRNSATGEGAG